MPLFGNGIDKAQAVIDKLNEARTTLQGRHQSATTELATLRGRLGETVLANLDSANPATDHRKMIELEHEVTATAAGLVAIVPKLQAAIKSLHVAQADSLRKTAAAKQIVLDKHNVEVARLKSALEEYAGCPYLIDDFPRGDVGRDRNGVMIGCGPIEYPPPARSLLLGEEIGSVLKKAREIEAQPVDVPTLRLVRAA